ncbi:thioredoxin family protein [Aurantibacter sp.]|uniref:TlpA family protein disulfide reductase n=1 Tax=Aurantibacter sp. TaxID=2807103 RepID=UPI0032644C9A
MKTIVLTFLFLFIITINTAQEFNQEITIENQQPFLVGKISLEDLKSKTYKSWYNLNYTNYKVDFSIINTIKEELSDYKILLFMGTWCGDSKREVPQFIKILESANFAMENLKIVAVDKRKDFYKKSPTGEEWGLNITRVPTFIFYKNGRETNRIIESPIETLEADIKKIVTQKPYTPNYPKSLHLD